MQSHVKKLSRKPLTERFGHLSLAAISLQVTFARDVLYQDAYVSFRGLLELVQHLYVRCLPSTPSGGECYEKILLRILIARVFFLFSISFLHCHTSLTAWCFILFLAGRKRCESENRFNTTPIQHFPQREDKMGRQTMASDLFTKRGAQGSLSPHTGLGAYQRGAISKRAQAQDSSSKDTDSNVGVGSEKQSDAVSTSLMTPPNTAPLNQRWFCQDSLTAPSLAEEPFAQPQALRPPGSSDGTMEPEDSEKSLHPSQTRDNSMIIADIDRSTHRVKTADDTARVLQTDQHPAPTNDNVNIDKQLVSRAITRHMRGSCHNELAMAQRAIFYPGLTTDRVARIPGLVQSMQQSPELRRQVLHSRIPCFQFLLLPRDIRDTIACHLFATGSLGLLRVCSKLHDELEPLIGEHAICRISIGASTHVKPIPLLTAEENSGIDQVQITILRIFDERFPQDSNIEHLSHFASPQLIRSCCRVTIVSYPEQCWKPDARILEILGMYIYFKKFILDVRIIHPHLFRPQPLDPASLTPASSSIRPESPNWHTISQPASWNDVRAAAMLLQNHLGPFHLPRNEQGAVFHPLDFHRELQISDIESMQKGFYNPEYESFYVPVYDGTRPHWGPETVMLFTRPITYPDSVPAPASAPAPPAPPVPAPAPAPTRSSNSPSTHAARPVALPHGAEQTTRLQTRIVQNTEHHGHVPLHTLTHSVSWYELEPPGQQPFIGNNSQLDPQPQPRTSNIRAERPRQVTRQVCLPNTAARPLNQSRPDSTDPIARYPYAPTRPRVQTVPPSEPSATTDQRLRPKIPNIHAASEAPRPQFNAPPPQSTTQPRAQNPSSAKPKRSYNKPTSDGNSARSIAPRPYTQPDPLHARINGPPESHQKWVNHAFSSRRNVSEHLPARTSAATSPTSQYYSHNSRAGAPGAETATSGANNNNSMGHQQQQQQQQQVDVIAHRPTATSKQKQKKGRALSISPPHPSPKKPRRQRDDDGRRTNNNNNTADDAIPTTTTAPRRMGTSSSSDLSIPRRPAPASAKSHIPTPLAIRHLIDLEVEHDEGEESERSVEEIGAAVALGWMSKGSTDGKKKEEEEDDDVGGGEASAAAADVVDRGRESSGWRVVDLG